MSPLEDNGRPADEQARDRGEGPDGAVGGPRGGRAKEGGGAPWGRPPGYRVAKGYLVQSAVFGLKGVVESDDGDWISAKIDSDQDSHAGEILRAHWDGWAERDGSPLVGDREPGRQGRARRPSGHPGDGNGIGHWPAVVIGKCYLCCDRPDMPANFGIAREDLGDSALMGFCEDDPKLATTTVIDKSDLREPDGSPLRGDDRTGHGPGEWPRDYASMDDAALGIEWAADIDDGPIEWINEMRLAAGKLHVTAGAGGVGKSQIALAKVAAVTTGGPFPDGGRCLRTGVAIILAAEDDKADTIKPRLKATGADMSKVVILRTTLIIPGEDGKPPIIDLVNFQNLAYWEEIFRRLEPVLLTADPLAAYMGTNINDHHNADVRRVLEPFVNLLGRYGVAMEAVAHVGKSIKDKTAVELLLGSVAYGNLARRIDLVWLDPDRKGRYIVTNDKLTLGPTQPPLAYSIEGFEYEKDGRVISTSRTRFEEGPVEADPYELALGQKGAHRGKKRGPKPVKIEELARFLVEYLKDKGPVFLGEIARAAGEEGLIGKLVEDEESGKAKWTRFSALYDAARRIPDLPPPHNGWEVVTSTQDPDVRSIRGKARWLIQKTTPPTSKTNIPDTDTDLTSVIDPFENVVFDFRGP